MESEVYARLIQDVLQLVNQEVIVQKHNLKFGICKIKNVFLLNNLQVLAHR
jgi:hypothetical protein